MPKYYYDFKIKVSAKSPKKRIDSTYKKQSKLVTAIVFIDGDGKYKVRNIEGQSKDLILEFTPESYNLKGRESIFTKCKKNFERRTRIIRTKDHAIAYPGSSEIYVPFAPNWEVNGYIVKCGINNFLFEFNDIITIHGYRMDFEHSK